MPERYALACQYPSKTKAGNAYDAIRNLIHANACELSAYRFYIGEAYYVLVIGHKPSITLEEPIKRAMKLFKGVGMTLPDEVIQQFYARHFEQTQGTVWREQSYE